MFRKMLKVTLAMLLVSIMIFPMACSSTTSQVELVTSVEPGGAGTVSPGGTYDTGTKVRVTATPYEGYVFDRWSGAAIGNSPTLTITMDADKSLVAHYLASGAVPSGNSTSSSSSSGSTSGTTPSSTNYMVTIGVTPAGAGTVAPLGGIYPAGSYLTLTATPSDDYYYVWWSGDISGDTRSVSFMVDSDKTILVHFETENYTNTSGNFTLTTHITPEGAGVVIPSGGSYEPGTNVRVTAMSTGNYVFHHWSGAVSGIAPTISVRMDDNKSVVANFEETGTFTLYFDSLTIDNYIPDKFSCESNDVSPFLYWDGVPYGTKSFVLMVEDPDASSGVFTHWIVYNIPASARKLGEGIGKAGSLPDGTQQGKNSYGELGYDGPCPPRGEQHRYIFSLYALDTTVVLPSEAATRKAIHTEIQEHIIATAQVTGLFNR